MHIKVCFKPLWTIAVPTELAGHLVMSLPYVNHNIDTNISVFVKNNHSSNDPCPYQLLLEVSQNIAI